MRTVHALALWFALGPLLAQKEAPLALDPVSWTEAVGLSLNKAQVLEKAQMAWAASFGQEPGARVVRTDAENGVLEGEARLNYRSSMLMAREETLGSLYYKVTITAKNGQCTVRAHDLTHVGNHGARGGGLDVGPIYEGTAPERHYQGLGLAASRRLHDDMRTQAATRISAVIRTFSARLRTLAGE